MDLRSPDPLVTRRQKWEFPTETNPTDWFDNNSQWLAVDTNTWEYTGSSGVEKYRAKALNKNSLRVTREMAGWTRYVIYFALLMVVPMLLSPSWIYILLFLCLSVYGLNDRFPLAESPGQQVTQHVHTAISVIYFAGIISIVLWANNLFPTIHIQLLAISLAGFYAITRLYSHNAIPFQSNQIPGTVVRVPLNALRGLIIPVGSILWNGIVNAWVVQLAETVIENLKQPGRPRGIASLFSDATGGAVRDVPPVEFFSQLERWFPILIAIVCLYIIVIWTQESFRSYSTLKTKIAKFAPKTSQNRVSKSVRYGLVLFWSGMTLGITAFAVGLVAYPIIHQWILPASFVQPFSPLLPSATSATPSAVVGSILEPFYALISLIPGLQESPTVGILLAILLLPAFYLVGRALLLVYSHR